MQICDAQIKFIAMYVRWQTEAPLARADNEMAFSCTSCSIRVMNMLVEHSRCPRILGSLAIYTPDLSMARVVYDIVVGYTDEDFFGTVFFESGEEINWIDLHFRALRRRPRQ